MKYWWVFYFKMENTIICGIYKITSPSGKIYIGESKNIIKRFDLYRKLVCKSQTILYNSLAKHGFDNHTFEVIEECDFEELKCRERHWQDFYDVLNGGLNCILTKCGEKKGIVTQEIKDKIGKANKGKNNRQGENNPMFGKTMSSQTKIKQSESMKDRYDGEKHHNAKPIINIETKEVFMCQKTYCQDNNISYDIFNCKINGKYRNDTDFVLYEDYLKGEININKINPIKKVINIDTEKIYKNAKEASLDYEGSYTHFVSLLKHKPEKLRFKYLKE